MSVTNPQALPASAVIAVVGTGAMGAGIAQVAASAGHVVKLLDNRPGAAAKAIEGIRAQFGKLADKGKMSAEAAQAAGGRLVAVEQFVELADAALVIEAIVENLEAKQKLYRDLEDIVGADCIFGTNTSSISVTSIGAALQRPERLAGLHFFNPAPLMKLVEIVSGLATGRAVADTLFATAAAWGKTPVHARSTPGFIVNRVARPYYAEALRILNEGGSDCATLDAILRDAGGFRMGAFELTDLIGHDVNYAVTCSVFDAYYGDFRFQPSLIQKELVDAGRFGRKSGRGCGISTHAPFVGELGKLGADAGDGLGGGVRAVVEQLYHVARRSGDLGDAGTHGAGADDGDDGGGVEGLVHAHSPVNFGARFSMKAATPSA